MLFQIDMGQVPVNEAVDWMRDSVSLDPDMEAFAVELVREVISNQEEIDSLIARYSVGWDVDRMAGVDRNLLRLGIFEMFYRDDIPLAVTINEMVELGKRFGDVNSGRFINGILGKIKKDIEALDGPIDGSLSEAAEGLEPQNEESEQPAPASPEEG